MSTIEIDEDLLNILEKMKGENESINDVLRKILLLIGDERAVSLNFVSKEEFEVKSEEILRKYQNLLVRLSD